MSTDDLCDVIKKGFHQQIQNKKCRFCENSFVCVSEPDLYKRCIKNNLKYFKLSTSFSEYFNIH